MTKKNAEQAGLLWAFRRGEIPLPSGVPRLAAISGYLFAFLLLSALTWLAWQYRYEPLQDVPALALSHTPGEVMRVPFGKVEAAGEGGAVRLKAATEIPRIELRWRGQPQARYAHIRLVGSCQGLVNGKYAWEDGRVSLLWIDADGKLAPDPLTLWSANGNTARTTRDMVVPLARHGTLPKIIITNRGSAGEFTLHSFSVQPVAYRPGIRPAIVLLVCAWFAWAAWGLRGWIAGAGATRLKIAAAAALWVAFGWYSSLPGPWIPWQPIGESFPIEVIPSPAAVPQPAPKPATPPAPPPAPVPAPPPTGGNPAAPPAPTVPAPAPAPVPAPPVPAPQPLPAAEEGTPEGIGGPIRWLLARLPALKKIAHLAGFALLTALLGLLTGNRRAIWPALVLAALSEFCQWAFGFGFGWDDVLDLALDTAAVFAGLLIWRRSAGWGRRATAFLNARKPGTGKCESSGCHG